MKRAGRGRVVRKETRTFWDKSDTAPRGTPRFYLIRKKNLNKNTKVRDISPMTQPVIGWAFSLLQYGEVTVAPVVPP